MHLFVCRECHRSILPLFPYECLLKNWPLLIYLCLNYLHMLKLYVCVYTLKVFILFMFVYVCMCVCLLCVCTRRPQLDIYLIYLHFLSILMIFLHPNCSFPFFLSSQFCPLPLHSSALSSFLPLFLFSKRAALL